MKYPEIQYLYKYMPWNEFTKKSIDDEEFWFSSPIQFNDPIDCGISLNTIGNTPLLKNTLNTGFSEIGKAVGGSIKNPFKTELVTESIQQLVNSLTQKSEALSAESREAKQDFVARKELKEKLASLGILSLSELGDNILMWSHYAQQHKGICVEFERVASNILGSSSSTLPVRYSIKAPIIDAWHYRIANKEEQNEMELSLALAKANDWAYEREWRVIKTDAANRTHSLGSKINSITLGLRVEESTKTNILSVVKRIGFSVKKANLKPNEFGLNIEEIQ